MRRLLVFAALLVALPAGGVDIEWVFVGDPGNPVNPDPSTELCGPDRNLPCGSVAYDYWISKYEVTNTQYAAFLNAIAASDPKDTYNDFMGTDPSGVFGGITRSGYPGSYVYAVKPGFENKPVVYVSFYDALRFANWLHNGEPTGAQDEGTTEDGAYTITGPGIADNAITRNPGATAFLTSEDEWYKAAYFDEALGIYYDYPTGTDTPTTCSAPGATANTANCDDAAEGNRLTEVGAYTNSASPFGTFDQGGNLWEWNETKDRGRRGLRGGNWDKPQNQLSVFAAESFDPGAENGDIGFRVATVPEPTQVLLVLTGSLVLAGARRPRRPSSRECCPPSPLRACSRGPPGRSSCPRRSDASAGRSRRAAAPRP